MKKLFVVMVCCCTYVLNHAQFTLSGNVTSDGEPLAAVPVTIEGTFQKVFTDAKGHFAFKNIKGGNYNIQVSYRGYYDYSSSQAVLSDQILDIALERLPIVLESAVITGTNAAEYAPVSQTNLNAADINAQNLGKDLPYLLESTPSVVAFSDAGAGVGYTGLRIRGTDATRINVTFNGIPVNDAESQGVFWVNTPDIASSASNIQVQRGVGTSTNGSGAFGASINIQTNELEKDAFATISSSAGMFNTFKNTVEVNSGLLGNHFIFNGRLSKITSDGYIDRGWSDLKSFFFSGGYFGKKTIVKFNIFSGAEKTYQAWNGLPEDSLLTNRTYNSAGTNDGTKPVPYDNETDNYQQDYYQLFITQYIGKHISLNVAGHYTRGKGYYEQYKTEGNVFLPDYQIIPPVINGDTIFHSDLIRRLWLDNHYFGGTWNLNYSKKILNLTVGGGMHHYTGAHYGTVNWARYAGNSEINHEYYRRNSDKTDLNIYTKAEVEAFKGFKIFADLQFRFVNYHIGGFPENEAIIIRENFYFFNPKAGIRYDLNSKNNFYAYFGIANKEPNRVDYETTEAQKPVYETLRDLEFGYTRREKNYVLTINGYFMDYTNQLVQTGGINDVGAYTRANAKSSYRLGIEVESAIKILKNLQLDVNLNLSLNRIRNFTELLDNYDSGIQESIDHGTTTIAFSPPVVGFAGLRYTPVKGLDLNLSVKYVDQQYLDNTSNRARMLDRYAVADFRVNYVILVKKVCSVGLNLGVYNFTNTLYAPNGYTFSYIAGGETTTENFYYPQAGIHVMGGIQLKFGKFPVN